ncbi:MAG TPA: hypothetical protein VGR52_02970 [Stellaceae bacterium]|nr:hypothetical protein [Stellaceae bacterium]
MLKAAAGEHLGKNELTRFREVAERDPPEHPVKELWCIVGRRGGKDAVASAIATTAAFEDYSRYLRPGERASVLCLAVDRDQARILLRYIRGYFATNTLFHDMVERETDSGLELINSVEVIVATNSFRAVRGKTIACVVLDEVAFWRDESSANPDEEVYAALLPGLVTLPGAMLIGISTPYRRSGLLFAKWRDHYGVNDPDVLVVKGPSTKFNPTLPLSVIEKALAKDAEAASAEWLAEWRSDLADFVDRIVVERLVPPGCSERPPEHSLTYVGFCDPSGGSNDSMTLAIAHRQGTTVVLDCVRERRAPFSPDDVCREFAATLKSYGITEIRGDRYAAGWPVERFAVHGIKYEPADKPKNEIYVALLPMLNSNAVALLDNTRLISQLCSLERRSARSGKDSIDHPTGGHDDLVNAAAGALVRCGGGLSGSALWAKLGDDDGFDMRPHSAVLAAQQRSW